MAKSRAQAVTRICGVPVIMELETKTRTSATVKFLQSFGILMKKSRGKVPMPVIVQQCRLAAKDWVMKENILHTRGPLRTKDPIDTKSDRRNLIVVYQV